MNLYILTLILSIALQKYFTEPRKAANSFQFTQIVKAFTLNIKCTLTHSGEYTNNQPSAARVGIAERHSTAHYTKKLE